MDALVLDADRNLVKKTISKPEVKNADDVLIRISYAGLCGTDLHIIAGHFPSASNVVIGHEFVGTVEGIGEKVERLLIGDKVAVDPNRPCRRCVSCLAGRTNFCATEGPKTAFGVWQNGGCSQWIVVPADVVYKLENENLSLKEAVLIEPVSCIVRGLDNLGDGPVDDDADVLIQGAGIIGLLWLTILRHRRGGTGNGLAISDVAEGRLNVARGLPFCDDVDVIDARSLEGRREMYDVIVDCSGNATAIENALHLLRRGGKLSIFSCCPVDAKISVSPFQLYSKELTIVSSFVNPGTFPRAVQLVGRLAADRVLDLATLGVELFALDDVEGALDRLRTGAISKAVFTP